MTISLYEKTKRFLLDALHYNKFGVVATSVSMLFSQFFIFGCQFISGIVLARILQPEGRGQYAILILIPSCTHTLGNLALGIPIGLFSSKDPNNAPTLNANNIFASLFLTLIYSSAFLLLFHYGLLGPFSELIQIEHIPLISVSIFFLLFINYSQSLFLGTNYISAKNALRVVEPLTLICFLAVVAMIGHLNVMWAFCAWVAARAASFIVSIFFLVRLKLFSLKPNWELFRKCIKMGLKGVPVSIAGFIILQSDLFMLRYFTDDTATGIYSIAASLSFILMSIPEAIGTALFPNISKTEHVDGEDGTEKTLRFCRLTLVITVFLSFIAMILSPFLIELFYGKSYADSYKPFLVLVIAVSIAGSAHVLNAQIYARGEIWVTALCSISAALLNILLNTFLIPKYSFMGAAISSLISYLFFAVALSWIYLKMVKKTVGALIPNGEDFRVSFNYILGFANKVKSKLF